MLFLLSHQIHYFVKQSKLYAYHPLITVNVMLHTLHAVESQAIIHDATFKHIVIQTFQILQLQLRVLTEIFILHLLQSTVTQSAIFFLGFFADKHFKPQR
uniref:Uncharacterized protein n=1 Tax=Octopus bimaculoides TaxID=37653 RepID=A0A0L8HCE6_OCTBM